MPNTSQKTIVVESSPTSCPNTVGELIATLASYPMAQEISFDPFTLYRIKDRGVLHFEFNEIPDTDYTMHRGGVEE